MKTGQIVKVYQKPYSDEDFEGEAELVNRDSLTTVEAERGYEWWVVRFPDSDETFRRIIKVQ